MISHFKNALEDIQICCYRCLEGTLIQKKVTEIHRTNSMVLDLKDLINDIYSGQLLIHATSVFTETVFFMFATILILQQNSKSILAVMQKDAHIVTYALGFNSILLLITSATNSAVNKLKQTAVAVHRILLGVSDPFIHNQLVAFSLELSHRVSPITALGFFDVDLTLIHSVSNQ